jgi:hypothetical protein
MKPPPRSPVALAILFLLLTAPLAKASLIAYFGR